MSDPTFPSQCSGRTSDQRIAVSLCVKMMLVLRSEFQGQLRRPLIIKCLEYSRDTWKETCEALEEQSDVKAVRDLRQVY